jgi:two-component sensor histidine kinase
VELSPPVQPDGRTAADAAQEFIRCAVEGANPVFEWVHRGPDGDIPCEISLIRLPSAKGRLIRASITNISERKRAERRQHLLMRELDHRVKNNLAAVLALAEQTIAASDSLDAFQESYVGRIRTLARMHEALANSNWEDVQLDDVIRLNLGAFMENGRDRVAISGEKVLLPARASSPICMAIHELTTNATKYGALSSVDGRVAVDWRCEDSELTLTWTERGGPPVAQSTGRGFGMTLIKGMIEYELCGNVRMDFGPQGIECRFTVPLVRLKDEQRQEPS